MGGRDLTEIGRAEAKASSERRINAEERGEWGALSAHRKQVSDKVRPGEEDGTAFRRPGRSMGTRNVAGIEAGPEQNSEQQAATTRRARQACPRSHRKGAWSCNRRGGADEGQSIARAHHQAPPWQASSYEVDRRTVHASSVRQKHELPPRDRRSTTRGSRMNASGRTSDDLSPVEHHDPLREAQMAALMCSSRSGRGRSTVMQAAAGNSSLLLLIIRPVGVG